MKLAIQLAHTLVLRTEPENRNKGICTMRYYNKIWQFTISKQPQAVEIEIVEVIEEQSEVPTKMNPLASFFDALSLEYSRSYLPTMMKDPLVTSEAQQLIQLASRSQLTPYHFQQFLCSYIVWMLQNAHNKTFYQCVKNNQIVLVDVLGYY